MDRTQIERARERLLRDETLLMRTLRNVSDAGHQVRDGGNAREIDGMMTALGNLRRTDGMGQPLVPLAEQLLAAESTLAKLETLIEKRRAESARAAEQRRRFAADRSHLSPVHSRGKYADLRDAGFALIQRTNVMTDRVGRPQEIDVGAALDDFAAALKSATAALSIAQREHRIAVSAAAADRAVAARHAAPAA